jgi:predicted transcriptional regulator
MSKKDDPKGLLLGILKDHPEGATIQRLSKLSNMSRITVTKYIHELIGEGRVMERKIGVARLMFSKEKYMEVVREEDIMNKIRSKMK